MQFLLLYKAFYVDFFIKYFIKLQFGLRKKIQMNLFYSFFSFHLFPQILPNSNACLAYFPTI